ncbi:YbaK/EbsC family protein [Oceanivirga salmonicida]|uniref:YbaK/EbsC family protein n=1 Tax=Oceanivirga salmonicida TaxID=1769291 RepID=UPI000A6D9142|nr:YbaK/EbsC family protein [Oceanivirga salmonicida]
MEKIVYDLLNDLGIKYSNQIHEAITSVRDTDIKLEGQQVKNLVLKAKKTNNLYLIILKDEKMANLGKLAEILEEKRLSFANDEILEELLHCKAGTVTAFGLMFDKECKINVIIDDEIDQNLTVGFHPFINTKTTDIQFKDFMKFLEHVNHKPKFINVG